MPLFVTACTNLPALIMPNICSLQTPSTVADVDGLSASKLPMSASLSISPSILAKQSCRSVPRVMGVFCRYIYSHPFTCDEAFGPVQCPIGGGGGGGGEELVWSAFVYDLWTGGGY